MSVVPFFKVPVIRSRPHLEFVSYMGCVVPGCRWWCSPAMIERIMEGIRTHGRGYVMQNPYVVAHHVRRSSSSGTGVKPPDTDCCGLCAAHHSELHQRGEKTCATEWGLDLMEEAARIAAASRMLGFLPESAA